VTKVLGERYLGIRSKRFEWGEDGVFTAIFSSVRFKHSSVCAMSVSVGMYYATKSARARASPIAFSRVVYFMQSWEVNAFLGAFSTER
jgi:hypothetical protein